MKHLLFLIILFLSFTIEAQKQDFKHINFEKADSIAHSYQGYSLNNLPILTYKLTQNLDTQVEQFRAIYTWVCSNIESDHSFGEVTLRKRKKLKNDSLSFLNWNSKVLPKVFERLLNDKKTICTGYAYLIKEMAALVDIDCEIVDGYSRTTRRNVSDVDFPNHSWNTVKLNNNWYLVDATMASGYFDMDKNKFVKDYNDGYFFAEPDLFLKRNYPINSKWLLTENKITLNQFVEAPIVYGKTFKHAITPIVPKVLITEIVVNEALFFKFKISEETKIESIRLVLSSGLRRKTIKVNHSNYDNGSVELEHHFTKKGHYDIHLMVNTDIVVSYTVKVDNRRSNHTTYTSLRTE